MEKHTHSLTHSLNPAQRSMPVSRHNHDMRGRHDVAMIFHRCNLDFSRLGKKHKTKLTHIFYTAFVAKHPVNPLLRESNTQHESTAPAHNPSPLREQSRHTDATQYKTTQREHKGTWTSQGVRYKWEKSHGAKWTS